MALLRVQRSKLGDQVLAIVQEMIANQRFQPGARINVEELAREIGVSRTPLWEAVHRLEQDGLLVRVPHRGVFTAGLTGEQALELYAVRQQLEAMAARLAAIRFADAAARRMEALLRQQQEIVERGDLVAYSRSDFEFHGVVYEACGNSYLREMLERIKAKMRPLGTHIERILGDLLDDHRRLLSALRDHDARRAEEVFRAHNERVMRLLSDELAAGDELGSVGGVAASASRVQDPP
jgi:DNA-binding GntR family transcriptional regulator